MRTDENQYDAILKISGRDTSQYEQFLLTLSNFFPDSSPSIRDDDRMIWFKAGQSSVVGFLQKVYKDSMDESFER